MVRQLTSPTTLLPARNLRYGLGFWLHGTGPGVHLEGGDAGVSFVSVHDRQRHLTHTVASNTEDGAGPVSRLISAVVDPAIHRTGSQRD